MDKVKELKAKLAAASKVVFFGGAGTSTESGIPDFRSAAGLYSTEKGSGVSPEEMLSRTFFMEHPDLFFDFYINKMIHTSAKPGDAHMALAELEKQGKLTAIVTQNIDGLHQMAGSQKVLELHGSVHRNYCMNCSRFYSLEELLELASGGVVPRCKCGGIIKPDVVLYEEALDSDMIDDAVKLMREADLLIVGGTSLTVYPAAGLLRYFQGSELVLINKSATSYDSRANLLIQEPIGETLRLAVLDSAE